MDQTGHKPAHGGTTATPTPKPHHNHANIQLAALHHPNHKQLQLLLLRWTGTPTTTNRDSHAQAPATVVRPLSAPTSTPIYLTYSSHPTHPSSNRRLELCNAHAPHITIGHIPGARTNTIVRSTPRGPNVQSASTVRTHRRNNTVDRQTHNVHNGTSK